MTADDDVRWVQRMAEGDPSAMRELYAAFGQRLYAYALRLTGNPALAEDVTQDALVAAWRSAGRFRGESRVRTWLLGIVHNLALKAIRRSPLRAADEVSDTLSSTDPSPEDVLQAGQAAACVRRGIENLSLKHRMVLDLVFYHGLTLEETAKVLDCPVGTVKSRLNYAKEQLKGALEQAGLNKEVLR